MLLPKNGVEVVTRYHLHLTELAVVLLLEVVLVTHQDSGFDENLACFGTALDIAHN